MPKRKKIRQTSWAAPYVEQSNALDLQLRSDYQHRQALRDLDRAQEILDAGSDEYLSDKQQESQQEDPRFPKPKLSSVKEAEDYVSSLNKTYNARDIDAALGDLERRANDHSWNKNFWNHRGYQMNDLQAQSFQGLVDRTQQWQKLAKSQMRSLDIQDRVNQINNEIDVLQASPIKSQEDLLNINQKIQDLLYEQKQLTKEYDSLEEDRKAFESYVPGRFKADIYNLLAGDTREGGLANIFSNNPIFGKTTQMHDETGDFTRFTVDWNHPRITTNQQREKLTKALEVSNQKIKEWQEAFLENIKERDSYQVDAWYMKGAQNQKIEFFSKDFWKFGLSGLLAGATSDASKMIPAMMLGAATGGTSLAVGSAYGVGAGLGVAAAGLAPTMMLNYGQGQGENTAEIAMSYNERVKDFLQNEKGRNGKNLYDNLIGDIRKKNGLQNLNDDQIFERWRAGLYGTHDAEINKKIGELAVGIENQYQDDMLATTWGAGIESVLMTIPPLRMLNVARPIRYAAMRSSLGRRMVRGLKEGFEIGATAGPLVGAAYAPIHLMVKPLAKTAGKFGKEAINHVGKATGISKFIPESAFTTKFLNEPRKQLIKDIGGRWLLASSSEAIEEMKQSIAAEKYKSGEYTSAEIKSYGETILDDFLAGSKSAALLLALPAEGLLSEKDRDILNEGKGGFLLGGMQTTIVNAPVVYSPYKTQMNAREAVVNTILSEKAEKEDALRRAKIYAESSKTRSSYDATLSAMDRLRRKNKDEKTTSGEYVVDPKVIDDEEEEFKRVAKIARDAYTIKQAESQGIEEGTDEYNDFVAHKALAAKHLDDEVEVLNLAYDNYKSKLDEVTNEILSKELKRKASIIPGADTIVEDEYVEDDTLPEDVLTESLNGFVHTQTVAQYAAMLNRRRELEIGIENAKSANKPAVERILTKQLNNLSSRIIAAKTALQKLPGISSTTSLESLESVEKDLVRDPSNHEELVDLYRQVLIAEDDYELAKQQYNRITGKAYLDDNEITDFNKIDAEKDFDRISFKDGEAKKIMAATKETIDDDNDFMSVVSQDFADRTDDEGNDIISPEEKQEAEEKAPENNPEQEFEEELARASKKPYVQPAMTVQDKPIETIQSPSELVLESQPTITQEIPKIQPEPVKMSRSQKEVVENIKRRAEISKSRVKKVTPEHYLIQVGDELIQMPRVHSVMPKYWYGEGSYKAALQLGNAFDNLARMFFSDAENITLYEQNPEEFVQQWLDKNVSEDQDNPNAISTTYRGLYTSEQAFAETIKDLYELAKQYRDLGWQLSTDKIVWYSQFESGWVAGETDMLAVDKDGNIHIIDFKTAKGLRPFETYLNDDVYRTNKYQDLLSTLTEEDFRVGKNKKALSKAAKQIKRKIREAEGKDKNIMLEWQGDRAIIKYADSDYANNHSMYRSGPKQQEYSDQLTAYAEMIQKQLANVVDLEVVGFRTQYTADTDTNLMSVQNLSNQVGGKPFRIKVSFSDKMRGILNNEGPSLVDVDTTTQEIAKTNEDNTIQQEIEKAEVKANEWFVPKKSEDSILKPNEPTPVSHEDLGYSNLNKTIIEKDPELSKITASPEFIQECLQHGLVEVYTEIVKGIGSVYADITYNGKTYKRIYIYAARKSGQRTDDQTDLYQKVKQLEDNKQPGQKIVATAMKRTAGQIQYQDKNEEVLLTDTNLLAGMPLGELEFSTTGIFGFVKDGDVVAFADGDVTKEEPIYTYKGSNKQAPANGTLLCIKNPNHKENQNEAVPVGIKYKTYKDSIEFIVSCLKSFNSLDLPYVTEIEGKDRSVGVTAKELLSLIIPVVNSIDDAVRYSLIQNPQHPSVFHVVINTESKPLLTIDVRDDFSVEQFKQALSQVQMPFDNKVLVSRIGSKSNKTPQVFHKIKQFFGQNADVESVVITPDIKFDRSDVQGDGLTGFAWYVKNGRVTTPYKDIVSPLVSIGDVGYFDPSTPQLNEVQPVKEQPILSLEDDDTISIQFKHLTEKDKGKRKLTPKEIKEHLRPILGKEVDDPSVVEIITKLQFDPRFKDAAVVGNAHKDGIQLYGAAFEGVDFHEAFHRIFELFVPVKTRDKLYEKTAKNLSLDLSIDSEENNWTNHRLVGEYLADRYMEYRNKDWGKTKFSLLNKVLNTIRDIAHAYFSISDRQMYQLFMRINWGSYRSEKREGLYDAEKERFEKIFGIMHYEVHGEEFKWIMNDPMYEDVKNTAYYCIVLGQNIDLSGKSVSETRINRETFMRGADKLLEQGFDIFGTQVEPDRKSPGQLAMSEFYSNFDAVSDDIAAMFAKVSTDYKKTRREETEEDLDGDEESIASTWDENFFKWDYEFSRFDKATSRVKYFFAHIPDMQYAEDGSMKLRTNQLGMPQLIPMNFVFNEVLSACWDIDTVEELLGRTSKLASSDPMWAIINKNIQGIVDSRIDTEGKVDADAEALLTQLMNTIRSNRHVFMIAKASRNEDQTYSIKMQTSDADYNAREYTSVWSQILSKGGSEILKVNEFGQLVFNPKNPEAAIGFQKIARLFDFERIDSKNKISYVGLAQMLSKAPSKNQKVLILWDIFGEDPYQFEEWSDVEMAKAVPLKKEYTHRKITDINDPKQLNKVKIAIVDALNAIGINIHLDEFNYMLQHKYGSTDADALRQMIFSTDSRDSIGTFLYFLNTISNGESLNIAQDGTTALKSGKRVPFEHIYENLAFVKELGNWKYLYRHSHDELTVLATSNKRFYQMSDNDLFSDTLRALNKRGKWYDELKQDKYNYFVSSEKDANGEYQTYGSYVLQQLTENPDLMLQLRHLIGFKTDQIGDEGQDYFEISKREDYLSKVQILESGGIISLTLSDKKKYLYITGVELPGIDYSRQIDTDGNIVPNVDGAQQKAHSPKEGGLDQLDSVVTQFLSYAISEYESIKHAATSGVKVVNFKENGKRFSSLLGVWEDKYDKDGKFIKEEFIPFNSGNNTWEEDLAVAEAYFFSQPEDVQKALIKRNLNKILDKELETAEALGLIEKVGTDPNPYLNYKNKGLNSVAIESLKAGYLTKYPGCNSAIAESVAVVVYLNDISCKAIMSGQEMERLLSGNPAFYKWKYNENGQLVDRTVDELKRLGGLGSTGTNNFLELANMPEKYRDGKYRCAEVDNEMVASSQIDLLRSAMYEGELRKNAIQSKLAEEEALLDQQFRFELTKINKDLDITESERRSVIKDLSATHKADLQALRARITQEVDNSTVEDLEKALEGSETLKLSKEKAAIASESYAKDIDVADGGAYITDEMCEMLLRMEGSYSKDVEEAFDILRGRTKADYLQKAEAYQKVLTTVIGNQKYTAFGRRLQNGVSVPYYHKMALFPIFDCIATGKMRNVFDKMKQQGVDMLLINSAVKVGSQESKPIVWSDYREDEDPANENNFKGDIGQQDWKPVFQESFGFDTYDVDFSYLRKQLNTDPKDDEMLRMGTQAQKIIFSNLFQGRQYITQDGEQIDGQSLQNRIMASMRSLSDLGTDKFNRRFFVTNEDGQLIDSDGEVIEDRNSDRRQLDINKFAKEVSKMMSDRGADKNILKALEVVSGGRTSIPLGAISNGSWLESVLISAINKEVVDINTPGAFYIQRSIWAMQGRPLYSREKGNILGRDLYDGKKLQMINEEGSMDCVLSIDFFQHILPKVKTEEFELDENGDYIYLRDKNGQYKKDQYGNYIPKRKMRDMSFEEARQWLLNNGIIGGKANIVAYRIPTQAESSIHALRCVDVLPVVRDTVILPEEFTKITGSDFDIDKLGLSTINYKVDGKNEASDQFEEGTEQYYQNRLIRDFLTLLIDYKTANILHRSIDNDTKLLTDIVKELESGVSQQEYPYQFYALSTQTERKNDYITGKIGIGPFALNNNNHILTMLYGVKFKQIPNSIMTVLGLTDLSTKKDSEHNSVMSWLSALINAHVDIAKDPYISRLNVNPYTYNLINTLIRTGFGKNTFYFTTQPIMIDLAKAYMNASSKYMSDSDKSKYILQKEAVEKVAEEWFAGEKIGRYSYEELKSIMDQGQSTMRGYINDIFKQLINNGALRRRSGSTVNVGGSLLNLSWTQVQFVVYLANVQFAPYAQSVSNLVKYSKIDTKKHGKSYIEQNIFEDGFDDLFFNPDGTGLFEEGGLEDMARDSYILTKTRNAIAMTRNILKGQFLQATPAFDDAIKYVLRQIGRSDSKDVELNNKIARIIMSAIKSEFINDYAEKIRPNNPSYIHDLVSESEEEFSYSQVKGSNEILLSSRSKYDISSYAQGGTAIVTFVAENNDKLTVGLNLPGGVVLIGKQVGENGVTYTFRCPITGANNERNAITTPLIRANSSTGTIRLTGGKNTIYDRLHRLSVLLRTDPEYRDILDGAGEPINMLLRSIVDGKTFKYNAPINNYLQEMPDTYPTLKFVKLFNALDQNGVDSNYIIDGWDELLHDSKHPLLKEFAEDLVVYAFITSGDQNGFTKMFKQVPFSWRKESGYGDFIYEKINEFEEYSIDPEILRDAMLNNWFDNDVVRTYYFSKLSEDGKSYIPQFIAYSGETAAKGFAPQYNPLILAALSYDQSTGIYKPSIDSEKAPRFIKIPRRGKEKVKDGQRRYTVYERIDDGMKKVTTVAPNGEQVVTWVTFPIYAKVEPKGSQISGGYLMTEYGREDSSVKEYTPSREALSKAYQIGDFLTRQVVDQMKDSWGANFADIVESLNYRDMFEQLGPKEFFEKVDIEQLTPEEQKEAEEYKKACEGGKV